MDWSQSLHLGYVQGTCHAPLLPHNARNSLHRKPLRIRCSAEGQPRANGAMRTGSQLPADWHALQRINVRSAMPSQGGTVAEYMLEWQQC